MNDTLTARQFVGKGLRRYEPLPGAWEQSEPYVASGDLADAVNMALYLRRPLLLEGDPGCGKTRLAYRIAYELGYPLKSIYIRSTSRAQDLLYTFDAVRRLYDLQSAARANGQTPPRRPETASRDDKPNDGFSAEDREKMQYVKLGRLGEAIQLSQNGIPSVVLIDEIDKADIDFPNDLLLVLDRLQFDVEEVPGWTFDAFQGQSREERKDFLPLVIVTSNREKELPAPFLRRCLFYYIEFPDQKELAAIIKRHFSKRLTPLFDAALHQFWALRRQESFRWRKAPSTSELLDWVRILERDVQHGQLKVRELAQVPLGKLPHLEALVKNKSDRDALLRLQTETTTTTAQP